MKAKLLHLISADIDESIYWPDEEDNFSFAVDALIGVENEVGEESFNFFVCTPKWILTRGINKNFGDFGLFGRNMIIVAEYDFDRLKEMISKMCSETTGKDWTEIALKLSRFGRWEFEDCEPSAKI